MKKKTCGETRKSILELEEWTNHLNQFGDIELRFYNFLPQDFYFRQDCFIYTGPYLYGVDSQETVSFEYVSPSHGFSHYSQQFEYIWNAATNTPQQHLGYEVTFFSFTNEPIYSKKSEEDVCQTEKELDTKTSLNSQ